MQFKSHYLDELNIYNYHSVAVRLTSSQSTFSINANIMLSFLEGVNNSNYPPKSKFN